MPSSYSFHRISGGLTGLAVGDALGVPVEFLPREILDTQPVTGMTGYGTHNQPPGTWSDDAALAFCLAQSLCDTGTVDYRDIAARFVRWLREGYWSARGQVFDVGITTATAIDRLARGVPPTLAGPDGEYTQGNGALMRILPLAFYFHKHYPGDEKFLNIIHNVSKLTHGHPVCQMASVVYIRTALHLLQGRSATEAYRQSIREIPRLYARHPFETYLEKFRRILQGDLPELPRTQIKSSGYVIHTLEAALWSLLTTNDFKQAVLTAVNLGHDTDTTGSVTGGLAGILYGYDAIPAPWRQTLARHDEILDLAECLAVKKI